MVAALLDAYRDAAGKADEVHCGPDVGRCVFSECMCAAMWFRNVWEACTFSWIRAALPTFVQTDCLYSPKL